MCSLPSRSKRIKKTLYLKNCKPEGALAGHERRLIGVFGVHFYLVVPRPQIKRGEPGSPG